MFAEELLEQAGGTADCNTVDGRRVKGRAKLDLWAAVRNRGMVLATKFGIWP
jgi:hypothetical protein